MANWVDDKKASSWPKIAGHDPWVWAYIYAMKDELFVVVDIFPANDWQIH